MSAHFSKFGLNTYYESLYFQAHIPKDYPLSLVLQKSRAFRRLPPRLRKLSALAKRWAQRNYPIVANEMNRWYDDDGYELNPDTEKRLTDEEIDAQWAPNQSLATFKVKDIPLPEGGFADPDTWEPPPKEEEPDTDDDEPKLTEAQVLKDIASHGRERTVEEYGAPEDWKSKVKSDKDLARIILEWRGKPWPAPETS